MYVFVYITEQKADLARRAALKCVALKRKGAGSVGVQPRASTPELLPSHTRTPHTQ